MLNIKQHFILLLILLFTIGLLLFGFYLEYGVGLKPCPLCQLQRASYFVVGLVALIYLLHCPQPVGAYIYHAMILIFTAIGGTLAGRQIWLQHLPPDQVPQCAPDLSYLLDIMPLNKVLMTILSGTGDCAKVDWRWLGLSIAEWSAIAFTGILIATLYNLLRLSRQHKAK